MRIKKQAERSQPTRAEESATSGRDPTENALAANGDSGELAVVVMMALASSRSSSGRTFRFNNTASRPLELHSRRITLGAGADQRDASCDDSSVQASCRHSTHLR